MKTKATIKVKYKYHKQAQQYIFDNYNKFWDGSISKDMFYEDSKYINIQHVDIDVVEYSEDTMVYFYIREKLYYGGEDDYIPDSSETLIDFEQILRLQKLERIINF